MAMLLEELASSVLPRIWMKAISTDTHEPFYYKKEDNGCHLFLRRLTKFL